MTLEIEYAAIYGYCKVLKSEGMNCNLGVKMLGWGRGAYSKGGAIFLGGWVGGGGCQYSCIVEIICLHFLINKQRVVKILS